jgi:hypothetical protein
VSGQGGGCCCCHCWDKRHGGWEEMRDGGGGGGCGRGEVCCVAGEGVSFASRGSTVANFCTQPRYECGPGSADGDRGARPVMASYNFEIPAFGPTNGSSSYSEPESTPCPNAHITHHTRTTTRSAIFNNKHTECRLLNSRNPPRRSFPMRKQVDVPGQQLHQTPY